MTDGSCKRKRILSVHTATGQEKKSTSSTQIFTCCRLYFLCSPSCPIKLESSSVALYVHIFQRERMSLTKPLGSLGVLMKCSSHRSKSNKAGPFTTCGHTSPKQLKVNETPEEIISIVSVYECNKNSNEDLLLVLPQPLFNCNTTILIHKMYSVSLIKWQAKRFIPQKCRTLKILCLSNCLFAWLFYFALFL